MFTLFWEFQKKQPPGEGNRIGKLHETSLPEDACVCNGRWSRAAEKLLPFHEVDSEAFRRQILQALRLGRGKRCNVLSHGAADIGKSFILEPAAKVSRAFRRRGHRETFGLQGLHKGEIALLRDLRDKACGLPWDDWLAWGADPEKSGGNEVRTGSGGTIGPSRSAVGRFHCIATMGWKCEIRTSAVVAIKA